MTAASSRALRWAALGFLFAIPFGTKKFLFSFETPFSNVYTGEYTAAFLFGVDLIAITLVAACGIFLVRRPKRIEKEERLLLSLLAAFVFLGLGSLAVAAYPAFGFYVLVRLALAAAAAIALGLTLREGVVSLGSAMGAIGVSAAFQSAIALAQFFLQRSVGWWWLGETAALGPTTPGVAAILADGAAFLRGYGTFPHANLLAGFLVLGLVALGYRFLAAERAAARLAAAAGIAAVIAGILVSFSRSGWIVGIVAAAAMLGFAWRAWPRRRALSLAFTVVVSAASLAGTLWFAVAPRANLALEERPVSDRWSYNLMALELIREAPLGVGIGNQLFHSYDAGAFDRFGLTARGQRQPVHNLYLLMASEIGVVGLVSFLALLGFGYFRNWKLSNAWRLDPGVAAILLGALLLFGLFDHFLWDLNAGRLMLWAVLGMMWGVGVSPHRSEPTQ